MLLMNHIGNEIEMHNNVSFIVSVVTNRFLPYINTNKIPGQITDTIKVGIKINVISLILLISIFVITSKLIFHYSGTTNYR